MKWSALILAAVVISIRAAEVHCGLPRFIKVIVEVKSQISRHSSHKYVKVNKNGSGVKISSLAFLQKNACTLSSDIIILSFGDVLLHISPTHQMHREFSLACLRSRPLSSHLINP